MKRKNNFLGILFLFIVLLIVVVLIALNYPAAEEDTIEIVVEDSEAGMMQEIEVDSSRYPPPPSSRESERYDNKYLDYLDHIQDRRDETFSGR